MGLDRASQLVGLFAGFKARTTVSHSLIWSTTPVSKSMLTWMGSAKPATGRPGVPGQLVFASLFVSLRTI